jgi:hypothetical protein
MVPLFYGSLILIQILFACAIICLVLSIILRNSRLNKWKFASLPIFNKKLLVALIVLLFILSRMREGFFLSHIEWYPVFTKENIVGTWEKHGLLLTFDPNGLLSWQGKSDTYFKNKKYFWKLAPERSHVSIKTANGTLVPGRGRVSIETANGEIVTTYEVILFFSEYRLLDTYNVDAPLKLGFSKIDRKK